MTNEYGLNFLKQHQPMKSTKLVDNEVVAIYENVRTHFINNPDERCIPLFLNSFGEGDAHGVYQLVGEVMQVHPRNLVVLNLKESLQSRHASVRYWSAQIAADYPDASLVEQLIILVSDDDIDIRTAAVIALAEIPDARVIETLGELLSREPDEVLREILLDVIGGNQLQ